MRDADLTAMLRPDVPRDLPTLLTACSAALWLTLAGCGSATPTAADVQDGTDVVELQGRAWPEADAIFHRDPDWLGGDGAHSVDLPDERTLWLFGDSFIARDGDRSRRSATMVRNSIAVMVGDDPSHADIAFAWRAADTGTPASYFPEQQDAWFWPADGLHLDGALSVLLHRIVAAPGTPLGFAIGGFALWRTDADPDTPPIGWDWRRLEVPGDTPQRFLGVTLLAEGDHVYLFGVRESARHEVVLARYRRQAFVAGTLSSPDYWGGPAQGFGAFEPVPIIEEGATEFSVGRIPAGDASRTDRPGFALVYSRGFGATTLAWRTAASPEGPYGAPRDLYEPPESTATRPFVYAGKAHDHLRGAALVATYASNSFDFATLLDSPELYFPRFVRLDPP